MFSDENDFFYFFSCLVAFWKMLRKIFYSIVRKIKQKEQGVRRAFLENSL
jgi:hypothetical protein